MVKYNSAFWLYGTDRATIFKLWFVIIKASGRTELLQDLRKVQKYSQGSTGLDERILHFVLTKANNLYRA